MLIYPDAGFSQRRRYHDQFAKLKFRGLCRKVWGKLSGSEVELLHLGKVEDAMAIRERYDGGVQTVAISQIVGSESRTHDFDRNFLPLRKHNLERWVGIAVAKEGDVSLPMIELIQVGPHYFVRDGHHRISVARLFGQREMEATVTVWEAEACIEEVLATTPRKNHFAQLANLVKGKIQRALDGFNRPSGGFAGGAGTAALLGG